MTTRRSQDLTADLLRDLNEEEAAPVVTAPAAVIAPPAESPATAVESQPSLFLETALFLAPKTWLRPGVVRSGSTMSISAGPFRWRLGRR